MSLDLEGVCIVLLWVIGYANKIHASDDRERCLYWDKLKKDSPFL